MFGLPGNVLAGVVLCAGTVAVSYKCFELKTPVGDATAAGIITVVVAVMLFAACCFGPALVAKLRK